MLTMQSTRFAVAVLAAALSLLAASERSASAQADWINALRQGGYVIVFRHGATHADQADTDPL
jgi:ABC-type sugar transport system substrate-binding protein